MACGCNTLPEGGQTNCFCAVLFAIVISGLFLLRVVTKSSQECEEEIPVEFARREMTPYTWGSILWGPIFWGPTGESSTRWAPFHYPLMAVTPNVYASTWLPATPHSSSVELSTPYTSPTREMMETSEGICNMSTSTVDIPLSESHSLNASTEESRLYTEETHVMYKPIRHGRVRRTPTSIDTSKYDYELMYYTESSGTHEQDMQAMYGRGAPFQAPEQDKDSVTTGATPMDESAADSDDNVTMM